MKYFSLTLCRGSGAASGNGLGSISFILSFICLSSISLISVADPLENAGSSGASNYLRSNLKPSVWWQTQVSAILEDHLDLFPKSQIPKLAEHLVSLCVRYDFDPALILSLVRVESAFRIKAVSSAGAVGLMQIMPQTAFLVIHEMNANAKRMKSNDEDWDSLSARSRPEMAEVLKDPFVNFSIGIRYLAWLRDHYQGVVPHYLSAYNLGPARLDELLLRENFRTVKIKKYFEAIRKGVPLFRFYRRSVTTAKATSVQKENNLGV